MKRIILHTLVILSTLMSLDTVGQDVYWREGFEGGTIGGNPTGTPPGPNDYYATGANSGPRSWFLHGSYRTTGTACAGYGANHIRILNPPIITAFGDTSYLVTPVVDFGVRDIHFSRCQTTATARRMSIWVRNDTIGNVSPTTGGGNGWVRISTTFASTNINVDTFVTVPLALQATTRRVAFSSSQAANIDIDSIWLVSAVPIVTPVTFNGISANFNNGVVKVLWSNEVEENTATYEIEKSVDGRSFTSVGSVNANRVRNYSFFDYSPVSGTNYYRIKAVDRDGRISLSSVIRVNTGKGRAQLLVSPNPVTDNLLNLQIANVTPGNYTLRLFNTNGQAIYTTVIRNEGVSFSESIKLPSIVSPGVYTLQFTNGVTDEKRIISVK